MAVESNKPNIVPLGQDELARDVVLWVIPALCALFARPVPGGNVLRHARLQAGDHAAQLRQLLAAADFVVSVRQISPKALGQQAFPLAVFLRAMAGHPQPQGGYRGHRDPYC